MSGNKGKDHNLVRTILYAVCVSAWASTVAGAIQNCTMMVKMSCFDQLVAFFGTLSDFTWSKVVLAVGSFLFLTSIFMMSGKRIGRLKKMSGFYWDGLSSWFNVRH